MFPFQTFAPLYKTIVLSSPSQVNCTGPSVPLVQLSSKDAKPIFFVCARSPLFSRKLSCQARRRTIGCGRRASVSVIRGIRRAWSGEPVVVCHSQAYSGSVPCICRVVSCSPRPLTIASSTVSARRGDNRFPSCTVESTLRPYEDSASFQY